MWCIVMSLLILHQGFNGLSTVIRNMQRIMSLLCLIVLKYKVDELGRFFRINVRGNSILFMQLFHGLE